MVVILGGGVVVKGLEVVVLVEGEVGLVVEGVEMTVGGWSESDPRIPNRCQSFW